ncbi:hypothetical protein [Streptacidiphilus rugosus]|uniref:hypothetical protein n=1 Tax=Streptacidiphilus rugosus TaxID=405783 RepID=UPI0006915AC2
MGSLFEELEACEAAARARVEGLEAELAELSGKLELARGSLERLRIARETVAEVLAEMTPEKSAAAFDQTIARESTASAYAGAERHVIGVLTVPNWQPGMEVEVLPQVYRDILEVVADAPGPVRAKQIVPRLAFGGELVADDRQSEREDRGGGSLEGAAGDEEWEGGRRGGEE